MRERAELLGDPAPVCEADVESMGGQGEGVVPSQFRMDGQGEVRFPFVPRIQATIFP